MAPAGRRAQPALGEQGSMSVEMTALVWPVTAIMAVLLVGVWQLSVARLDVHTAAAAAARSASLADSPASAVAAADQAAHEALADAGRTCGELTVEVDTSQFTHGGHVEVSLTCRVRTGDLIGLGAPGSVSTSATARAPIEFHRFLEAGEP
jgi:Flp pilus assembly protein TadG